ncbi:YqgE/AlgH family protein, partial [Francisella tularensis subsp. holarctica]|nr:YqgE/AlgH family protein [Francisella tularensis subsp. holarctica]
MILATPLIKDQIVFTKSVDYLC